MRIEERQAQTTAKTAHQDLGEIRHYCRATQTAESTFERLVANFSDLKQFRKISSKYIAAIVKFNFFPGASAIDVRIMFALIALPVAWKVLSVDFSALREICNRPALFTFGPQFLYRLLLNNRCVIFDNLSPSILQEAAAFLLVVFVIFPKRVFLLPAIVLLWIIDSSAVLYRYTLYTIDTPLALLTIIFFTPVSFRCFSGVGMRPSPKARLVIFAAFAYVATYYIIAGVSKLVFAWDWPYVVRVGNYYPVSFIWHSQVMPYFVDVIAHLTSDTYLRFPFIDVFTALIVLIEQFLWILAPRSMFFRIHAGIFAVLYHIIVALTTGIVFITWFFIPIAVTFPFSSIIRRLKPSSFSQRIAAESEDRSPSPISVGWVAVVSVMAATVPSFGTIYPPFHNYMQFGWRYQAPGEIGDIYRLGWRETPAGPLKAFPLGQGGFLDFRHTGMMDVYVRRALNSTPGSAQANEAGTNLRTLLMATRGIGTNGWLLGDYRAPAHLLGMPGAVDMRSISEFYLMRGTTLPRADGRPIQLRWAACGEISKDGPDGEHAFRPYDKCRDEPASP